MVFTFVLASTLSALKNTVTAVHGYIHEHTLKRTNMMDQSDSMMDTAMTPAAGPMDADFGDPQTG